MANFENQVRQIVIKYGGNREKYVMGKPHAFVTTGTWNDEHKVVQVIEQQADEFGHQESFSVDLVTGKICG